VNYHLIMLARLYLVRMRTRVMMTYFGGQTFLQKGLPLYSGSVKNGRKEILIRKYVTLFAKKLHSGCNAGRGNLLEGPAWRENLQLLAVILVPKAQA